MSKGGPKNSNILRSHDEVPRRGGRAAPSQPARKEVSGRDRHACSWQGARHLDNPEDQKEDLHATIDMAFDNAERVLEDYARQLKPDTKIHMTPPRGSITKIFHDRGYGFIAADGDGHEVYFHRNSVIGERFDKLACGTKVRFAEEDGDKGPQASTVHIVSTS